MTPEEILKQCSALIASATTELASRLKAAEDKIASTMKECAAATNSLTELGVKHDAAVKELSAKIIDDAKRLELTAQTVAKEFARHTGVGAHVTSDGAAAVTQVDPAIEAAAKYEATLQKHFAATKSKAKAQELAIKEDAAGYRAFRGLNRDIKWAA